MVRWESRGYRRGRRIDHIGRWGHPLAESAQCEGDRAVTQFDVARLAHDVVGVGDDEVGESTVVFLESFGALCIWLAGHLGTEVGEFLAKLLDLGLGFEMLKSAADGCVGESDGDGAQGTCVELWVPLHDVKGTLRGEGVVVSVDTVDDLTLLGLGVWGDGEAWARRSVSSFGGRRLGGSSAGGFRMGRIGRDGGWIHKRDGGGTELCLGRDDFDAAAEDVDGGRHVVVVW